MTEKDRFLKIFQKTGAMLDGHFLLTSGRHSDRYFQCALVLQHPRYCGALCRELASRFAGEGITAVVGPAMGGIVMSYEVARRLSARSLFAERENGKMALRRGFKIKAGERVLVVEDVITTGGSVKEVIDLVREAGGEVAGAAVLVDRSGGRAGLGVRTESLLEIPAESYSPDQCPLCRQGLPFVKPGSRSV
ncbi:MAG: orotate phosphoribosyltransferase [Peptococcaceae bacterium]|nr:orotate phosphoribosyltransferase [Peptococcaceae bacterium]